MSNLKIRKQEYKETVEKDFNRLVQELDKDVRHPKETYIEMLVTLKTYFDDMRDLDPAEPWFDIEALINVIAGGKDYQTFKQNYQIGCFIEALVKCGSPARQACMATAELLGHRNKSPETSIKAHDLFKRSEKYDKDADAGQFVYMHVYMLRKFLMSVDKEFPDHVRVKKARSAYEVLSRLIDENIAAAA